MLCLFLLGLGGGIIVTGANALASDVSASNRGTALNLLNLFFGLGGLLTPFISANFFKRDSVKLCYLIAFLTAITLVINIFTTMPAPTGAKSFVFADVAAGAREAVAVSAGVDAVPVCGVRSRVCGIGWHSI